MNDLLTTGLAASACDHAYASTTSELVSPPPSPGDRWMEWNNFVEATPETGFMQSSWWIDFRSTCGFENFGITLKDGDGFVGGAVVLRFLYEEDCSFYYIQDGPVLPHDPLVAEEVFRAILEAIEERRRTES